MLYGGPAHIKIVAEWEPETKAGVFGVVPTEIPPPHPSATELQKLYQQPLEASLQDCLRIYTREETVRCVLKLVITALHLKLFIVGGIFRMLLRVK